MVSSSPLRVLALMEASSVTGPAKNLLGFCQWLRTAEGIQSGVEVVVATFHRFAGSAAKNGFFDAATAAGVRAALIEERFRFDIGVAPRLRALIAELRPSIIETHNNKSHLLLKCMPALRSGRLWFAYHHGYIYPDIKQRIYNQIDRLTLRSADRVITVCQSFAHQLQALGVRADKVRVLHNSVVPLANISQAERAALREEFGVAADEALILAIGRLSHEKGHGELLKALALLGSAHRRWKLLLAGAGPERRLLEKLAVSLGIAESVLFVGHRADVARLYAVADLFALPSLSEGSSNALLEAMMAKVPIVATRVGGNPEIVIDEKTGLLVSPARPRELSAALGRLLSDPTLGLQLAEAANVRAQEEFSPPRYRSRLLSIYAEAAGLRQSSATPSVA